MRVRGLSRIRDKHVVHILMLQYGDPLHLLGTVQSLQLSVQESVQESAADQSNQTDVNKLLADESFMSSILASLPGVDPNDPHVKELLASMQSQSEVSSVVDSIRST
ncbi:hypothetical protein BUALT_Bualt11G0043900 [Buddleja alternifolia]|uniref:Uncharacterized protein n=1 Tax=Buddleja alternifolia TaxID=168488 RepID=A0AAV6WZJ9_9LAMI|nr:hypothetical protein BUALT_Bualt11G0043900 [Buddleja alternifolia]